MAGIAAKEITRWDGAARRIPALTQGCQVTGQQVPGQDRRMTAGLQQVEVRDRGQAPGLRWIADAGRPEPEHQRLLRHADRPGAVQWQVNDRARARSRMTAIGWRCGGEGASPGTGRR
jgi:hypothetical protein